MTKDDVRSFMKYWGPSQLRVLFLDKIELWRHIVNPAILEIHLFQVGDVLFNKEIISNCSKGDQLRIYKAFLKHFESHFEVRSKNLLGIEKKKFLRIERSIIKFEETYLRNNPRTKCGILKKALLIHKDRIFVRALLSQIQSDSVWATTKPRKHKMVEECIKKMHEYGRISFLHPDIYSEMLKFSLKDPIWMTYLKACHDIKKYRSVMNGFPVLEEEFKRTLNKDDLDNDREDREFIRNLSRAFKDDLAIGTAKRIKQKAVNNFVKQLLVYDTFTFENEQVWNILFEHIDKDENLILMMAFEDHVKKPKYRKIMKGFEAFQAALTKKILVGE